MPKGAHYVMPARDKIPLTDKLDPTDTGVMRLQFRQIRLATGPITATTTTATSYWILGTNNLGGNPPRVEP
jgi:hypothetical protein